MKKPLNLYEEYQAVYVHIPFCVQKCLYCDFASYANCGENIKAQYVKALCQEIQKGVNLAVSPRATIYFGGGTPSTLNITQIDVIVTTLKAQGLWQQPEEATIEVNPGTVDLGKLKSLKAMGFSRISMGVQSLNNQELRTIGRIHTAEQALEAINWAKQAGFEHINADVIYGLPGQTLESLETTLTQLTATAIDHISVYGLIIEENTPLETLLDQGKLSLPDEDIAADMYDFVQSFLKQQGFTRYEISNYYRTAANGYSRHNDVYWHYYPYVAFGASAASFDGSERITRPTTITDYINWVQAGCSNAANEKYNCFVEQLTDTELLSEFMMMSLRRSQGANLTEAQKRYGVDVLQKYRKELEPFFKQQLIETKNNQLFLTEKGMAVGNQIFEIFV